MTTVILMTSILASSAMAAASSLATATAAAAATATAMAASMASSSSGAGDEPDEGGGSGECRLLGPFALIVQMALGALALLSLVYKRWRERPQRPVKIWFFDVSKQVVGSMLVHVVNVFMSILTSGRVHVELETGPPGTPAAAAAAHAIRSLVRRAAEDEFVPNPCSLYLLNLGIDTTIGIPILLILLRVVTGLVALTPWGDPPESIESGNYGSPPRAYWWLKQSVIYFCGLFGMKVCVLIMFLILPWISRIGDWALTWTEGNERLQIVFVMMLFPLIMNALQYYIIDSFIKLSESSSSSSATSPAGHERLPTEDDRGRDPFDGALADTSDSDDDDDDGAGSASDESSESMRLSKAKYFRSAGRRYSADSHGEYDPDRDGVVGTRPSASRERGSRARPALDKELLPSE